MVSQLPGRDQQHGPGVRAAQEEGFEKDRQWEGSGWRVVQK